jgi:hypothetical protein
VDDKGNDFFSPAGGASGPLLTIGSR